MLLLFSAATCMAQRVKEVSADELTMTCSKAMEHNEIYIIFSATPFVKAQDDRTDERLPRSLPAGDFRRWLTKNRVKDKDMVVINRLIKVTKR